MAEPIKMEEKKHQAVPMQVLVKGRIERKKRHDGHSYTQIITPAKDAYSRPQVVEVRSKSSLGEQGEEVSLTCELGGYPRKPYQFTDKATGEVLKVYPVDMTLDLVEG